MLTNLAIKYRVVVLILTGMLVLGGFLAYTTLPKESQPSIEIPTIIITTVYPGASPNDIENLITQRIEKEVQGLNGIKEIRSTSTEGVSSITVEFDPSVEMDEAFQGVRDRVDLAKSELPGDAEDPIVSEINLSEFPIMFVNLAGDYGLANLRDVAERLQDDLEGIRSVLGVDLVGGIEREVQVNVDLARLQGANLTFNDLVDAIRNENSNIPGGSIDVERQNFLVRVDGTFSSPDVIRNIVIKSPGGRPIYVQDVAEVVFGFKDRSSYARLQQVQIENEEGVLVPIPVAEQRALDVVTLQIKKRSGFNILDTSADVRALLDEFNFPAGTRVTITGDQSTNVRTLVRDLENNIIAGLIFVVTVLLFFLGARTATLVGIAIPISMLVSFIVFQVLGYTLNFIILFSLIIALGMLVDNAIVIVENIYRFREEGYSRFEAARMGTNEVALPVATSTATTIAAFAPMLFWPGIIGEFMSFMPLTLIITLASSLFVALIINPVITGYLVRLDQEKSGEMPPVMRWITAGSVALFGTVLLIANWRTFVLLAVAGPVLYFFHTRILVPRVRVFTTVTLPALVAGYRTFLNWVLNRDYSVKRAMLRNTFALGSFTLGFILLVVGGIVNAVVPEAAIIVLAPALVFLVLGTLGLMVHGVESLLLGGMTTVKAGGVFGLVMATILLLMYLSPREVELSLIFSLLLLPALIMALGLVGKVTGLARRSHLILTDNRARLLTGALAGLFSIIFLFVVRFPGTEFFPETDPNQVRVTLESALGTNIQASDVVAQEAQRRVQELLAEAPASQANVEDILVNVGVSSDAMFGGGASSAERSRITLNMVEYQERAERSTLTLENLRNQLQGLPGTTVSIERDQAGPPTGKPVNIEVRGPDFLTITRITNDIRDQLTRASESGAIPGLVDVMDNLNQGRPEVRVIVDRERAARFDLSTAAIARTVRAAINGVEASTYRDGENEYDIIVRLREENRTSLESLRNLTIMHEGQQIPLTAVADLEVSASLGSITRLNVQRVSTITADAAPGFNGNAILAQVQQTLQPTLDALPPSYTVSYTGASEEQAESFGFLTTALLIGVALIFMIMLAQFNSIPGPFIIIVAVGLSLIGVLLGLILTRTPFGLMTFIGVISLAGIVVNNGIVLVDYTQLLRNRGLDKREAIIQAGATRLRPVLLTALTTVIGLVPLTFGINIDFVGLLTSWDPAFSVGSENTQFWGPMGTSIIAGLTFGTFLTLVIVPVMYSSFDSLGDRLAAVLGTNGNEDEGAAVFTNGDQVEGEVAEVRPVLPN